MPQDWFTANAPKAKPSSGDWFAANAPKTTPPEAPPTPVEHPHARTARLVGEAAKGLGAGVLSTIYHGGDLIRRGVNAVMPYQETSLTDLVTGTRRPFMERVIERPEVKAMITPPQTPAGKLGYFGEQAAEFMVPLSKVARVTQGAPILARLAAEGAATAGVAGIQSGGDPATMAAAAAMGVVVPGAFGAAKKVGQVAKSAAAGASEGGLGGAVAGAVRQVAPASSRSMLIQGLKPAAKQVHFERALEQAMPEIKAAESTLGKPIENIDDLLAATKTAKETLMSQYRRLSGAQSEIGALVDGNAVANAMVKSIPNKLKLENPKAAAALIEKADTYRRTFPIEDMEKLLVETNAELEGFYSQFPFAQRTKLASNPQAAALEAQARSMRDAIYTMLDSGGDGAAARELKRRYGALMEVEHTAMRRANVAKRQQPESLSEQVGKVRAAADMAKGTWSLLHGDMRGARDIAAAKAGREMAKFLKEQQTTDALIRRAFAGVKDAPKPIPMPTRRPVRGLLPKGSIVTPPPADTSYVRSIPAEYGKP